MSSYALPVITRDVATEVWVLRSRSMDVHYDSFEVDYTSEAYELGVRLQDDHLLNLKEQLTITLSSYSDEFGACQKSYASNIDAEVTQYTHEFTAELGLTPFQLSRIEFWSWMSQLACDGFFWKFIDWRFKKEKGSPPKKHWGICRLSDFHEIYFAGCWLRAHKVFDASLPDPYHYTRLGGNENWRNQILRVEAGWDNEFVKALVEIIDEGGFSRSVVREKIVPPLRAWTSGANFTNLDFKKSKELIKHLIETEI